MPASCRRHAAEALAAQDTHYEALPDLLQPDFYHPYKKGASRFLIRVVEPPLELHIVDDSALGLTLSSPGIITTGLSLMTAHPELRDLCQGVNNAVLSAIKWTCLGPFINGWLTLAHRVRDSETELVFLMEAERLIDANDVDMQWCKRHIQNEECLEVAQRLLMGKERRQLGSNWD